ncbi:MAG: type 1 glutamine amidotransferase domain-containing protein [Bradymonadaceae bacterium]
MPAAGPEFANNPKIALLAEAEYEDMELWYPYYRLQEAGADVDILGTGESSYPSKRGHEVTVDYKVDNAVTSTYDGVVIPGGWAPDKMRRHPPMVRFVDNLHDRGGICAAICHAGWMLISAGLVDGRKCTSYSSIREDMENAGADWVDREVVRDGQVITSRKPDDLPAFCQSIIGAFAES